MSTVDTDISDCIDRLHRLAIAIKNSDDNRASAEMWMRLESVRLADLLTQRASYNNRPAITWTWIPTPPLL